MSVITEAKASSRMKGWIAATLVVVDVFFVWTYVLWSNADTWAVNRSEEASVDLRLLLPNSHMMWITINFTAVALVVANILLVRVWVTGKRTSVDAS